MGNSGSSAVTSEGTSEVLPVVNRVIRAVKKDYTLVLERKLMLSSMRL